MNRIARVLFGIFLAVGLTSTASAKDFSADMVHTMGKKTMESKVYVSGDKIRTEMPQSITILRKDTQMMLILMPADKMYMEHPFNPTMVPPTSERYNGEVERKSLGMEEVNGQQAEKFEVTYTEDGQSKSLYQWMADGFPVKTAAVDGSWSTEYKNISFAAQPAELFEPPADYTKMDMPSMGGMMKQMMGK